MYVNSTSSGTESGGVRAFSHNETRIRFNQNLISLGVSYYYYETTNTFKHDIIVTY
jgi:ribosomal protein L28